MSFMKLPRLSLSFLLLTTFAELSLGLLGLVKVLDALWRFYVELWPKLPAPMGFDRPGSW